MRSTAAKSLPLMLEVLQGVEGAHKEVQGLESPGCWQGIKRRGES